MERYNRKRGNMKLAGMLLKNSIPVCFNGSIIIVKMHIFVEKTCIFTFGIDKKSHYDRIISK